LRYYCDDCDTYKEQAISIRRLTTDLLDALESQLYSRMLSEPDSSKRKKIAVDR